MPRGRIEQIGVLIGAHDHGRVIAASPRAPLERAVDAALVINRRLRIFVHAGFAVFAVRAAQQRHRRAERAAAVGALADQQIAIFGRAGEHIQFAPVYEHFAPEAGIQLADIVPARAVVVRAEDQRQVLREIAREQIHRREQITVRMAHHRGRAQIMAGEGVRVVARMKIVDHRADRLARAEQPNAALLLARADIQLVIGCRRKAVDRGLGRGDRRGAAELAPPLDAQHHVIAHARVAQPLAVYAGSARRKAADVYVAGLEEKRLIGRIAPGCASDHVKIPSIRSRLRRKPRRSLPFFHFLRSFLLSWVILEKSSLFSV